MQTSKDIELKAWKRLAELRGEALGQVAHQALTKVQYCENKPEELFKQMEYTSNRDSWDFCGILHTVELAEMRLLEYLLDDRETEVRRTRTDWRPEVKQK